MEMMNAEIPSLKKEWELEVDFETNIRPWREEKENVRTIQSWTFTKNLNFILWNTDINVAI